MHCSSAFLRSPDLSTIPSTIPNRGIEIHHQEHQNSGAEFRISSKKHQFFKHQRRGWRQIPKIGEKSERERNFNIASKTACRGFKSFCPCHRHGSLQTPTFRRLRAFLCLKKAFHGSEIGDNKSLERLKSVLFLTVIASKEHQFFIGNPPVNPR